MTDFTENAAGLTVCTSAGKKLGFHGAAPSAQRAGAAQAAAAVAVGEAPTKAEFDAVVALCNELRAALVEKGLIKGAA